MASYPSPPALRLPYDRDGSAGVWMSVGPSSPVPMTQSDLTQLNSEGHVALGAIYQWSAILFADAWDIVGYFLLTNDKGNVNGPLQWSNNTTTGIDGTWTTIANPWIMGDGTSGNPSGLATTPWYRENNAGSSGWQSFAAITGVTALRWTASSLAGGGEHYNAHFYGTPSSGANPDSLQPWHPTLDQIADGSTLDFGDIARATNATLTFRVKNISATKTANNPVVAMEVLTDASPALIGQFQLSTDNITFSSSVSIASLAPGDISPLIYVRDNVDAGAAISVWALRMVATAASFT